MSEFYKPYQKEIYAINNLLPQGFLNEQDKQDKQGYQLLLNTFDYTNRSINYNAIHPERRRFDKDIIENILKFLNNNREDFENYIKKNFPSKSEDYIELFKKNSSMLTGAKAGSLEDMIELHYHLVDLCHSFPNTPDKNIDGILIKVETQLTEKNVRFKYVIVDILENKKNKEGATSEEFTWVEMRFFDDKDNSVKINTDGEAIIKPDGEATGFEIVADQRDCQILEKPPKLEKTHSTVSDLGTSKIFYKYLYPLFFDKGFKADSYYKAEHFPQSFIVLPIYSAEFTEGDFGTVIAHLFLPFDKEGYLEDFLEKQREKLNELWETWTGLILRTLLEGRVYEINRRVSEDNDVIKDFLHKLTFVQDWERVMVFRNNSDSKPLYCFKRLPGENGLEFQKVWNICKDGPGDTCEECLKEVNYRDGERFFRKEMKELLDIRILPSIEVSDIERYKTYILYFEFPEHTFFPPKENKREDNDDRKKLGDHYINKLIPILDQLLLKRKVLKHGLRAAVTAIMSRNMSHNIGSHVLSYWYNVLNKNPDIPKNELAWAEARLIQYLRQRMDFIAEACTTNPSWSTSMMFCKDILISFIRQDILLNNIVRSEGIVRDNNESDNHPMHFKICIDGELQLKAEWYKSASEFVYIESEPSSERMKRMKESQLFPDDPETSSSVSLSLRRDFPVSVPHGMVGLHAFYSILENFIRNSAKHGGNCLGENDVFEITISADTKKHDDFVEIVIQDNLGNCNLERLEKFNNMLCPGSDPLIDSDGKLKPGNWGFKEQRISANFLRMGRAEDIDTTSPFPPLWSEEAMKKQLLNMSCDKSCKNNQSTNDTATKNDARCGNPNVNLSFCLLKPKEVVLVLSDNTMDEIKGNIETYKEKGIYPVSKESFEIVTRTGMPHRFVAFENGRNTSLQDVKNKNRFAVPIRFIELSVSEEINELSVEKCYEFWNKKVFKKNDETNYRMLWRDSELTEGTILDPITCSNEYKKSDIVFDRHGECWNDASLCLYYQSYSGDNSTYRLLKTLETESIGRELKPYELIEACLTHVIIADERIWKKSQGIIKVGQNNHELEVKLAFEKMRIRLVPIVNNRTKLKNIKTTIEEITDEFPCFLVIHQGLIDKMEQDDKEELKKLIKEKQENKLFYYIITSGRGTPTGISKEDARFIEISNIESFIEEFDKFGLVQTLFSLRRDKNQ